MESEPATLPKEVEGGLYPAAQPWVAVVLCATEDTRFILEQFNSIKNQKNYRCHLTVAYDGQGPSERALLDEMLQDVFEDGGGRLLDGPRRGFAANFLTAICDQDFQAEYYAFSDQDDIWEEDKLARAIDKLSTLPEDMPAVYCSRTRVVDQFGEELGFSPLFRKSPCFSNALVQSIAGGNTMVFNRAALELIRQVGVVDVASHDWWVYMLVSGAGGKVIYDSWPSIRYRQHDRNFLGVNNSWSKRIKRIHMLLHGRFKEWNDINIKALEKARPFLTAENQHILDGFSHARRLGFLPRCWRVWKTGVYRQTILGNLGLAAATLLKKL